MRTAAVVVAWHQPDITLEALRSLAAMRPAADQVLCVAQELTPDERERLSDGTPRRVEVVDVPDNRGFAAAANLGIDRALSAGAEWVLLLNNDATVAEDCLSRCLTEAMRDPRVAAVGPAVRIADRPDQLWFAGARVSHRLAFTMHRRLGAAALSPPPSGDTDYVPGCCMLLRAAAWRDVGPFREDFFLYYEDAEWGVRARAAGWRLRYLGEVLCDHAVAVSSGGRGSLGLGETTAYYAARNSMRFALDTPSRALRVTRVLGLATVWTGYNAWRVARSGRLSVARAYADGLRDAWRGRMGPRPA